MTIRSLRVTNNIGLMRALLSWRRRFSTCCINYKSPRTKTARESGCNGRYNPARSNKYRRKGDFIVRTQTRPPRKFTLIGPHVHLIAKHEISWKRAPRFIPSVPRKKILIRALCTTPRSSIPKVESCEINVHEERKNISCFIIKKFLYK